MKKEEIGAILDSLGGNDIYAVTYASTKLTFADGSIKVGYFLQTNDPRANNENKFGFIENNNKLKFKEKNDTVYMTFVDINQVVAVEYPSLPSSN
jgi:hypothetical protein